MLEGKDKSINEQIEILTKIIEKNSTIMKILDELESYSQENPNFRDYYLAAGCINQTVFNYYHGKNLNSDIKDYDIAYFDDDISYEAEDKIIKSLTKKLKKLNISFDIKNQKRVPIWYKEKYGITKAAYNSTEDAIARWGASVTCIGVRLEKKKLIVACPYGLNDLFAMKIRPISVDYDKKKFLKKCQRWKKCWPKLELVKDGGFPKKYEKTSENSLLACKNSQSML